MNHFQSFTIGSLLEWVLVLTERLKLRRNFLLGFLISVFFLLVWLVVFFFVPPEYTFNRIVFLLFTFFVLFFSASLLLANTRRGLIVSSASVVFLILGYFGAGNWLNFILIAGIVLVLEYYLKR